MIKKCMYEAPEAELFLIKFEEDFLQGTGRDVTLTGLDRNGGYGSENDLDDEGYYN